jgi:hypothetical protein
LIANQLDALGFQKMYARSLRPKHVERLVAVWKNGHEELGWKPVCQRRREIMMKSPG